MKTFDQFEKSLINKIVNDTRLGRNIINILDEFLDKTCVKIDITTRAVDLKFEIQGTLPTQTETDWIINQKLPELQIQIIQTLNLTNYLEKNGFITTFKKSNVPQTQIQFGKCAVNLGNVGYSFPDPKTNDLLIEYAEKEIMPSPDLAEFVANKYQTKDDLRYKNQKCATWTGIIISIVVGLFSIGFGISSIYQSNNDNEIVTKQELDSLLNQHNSNQVNMLEKLDNANKHLEQLMIDTLSVSVTNEKIKTKIVK
ncbi:MAG: hypothetical protein HN952_04960 [Candidatus Cloacimonetes bacterium]|jgi:hypothetical protein|nr:hypothetical protein [Candidatus Cloacimonadota bacterium]MBT6994290.1 hypothetical protein [Candidatus Cloacimonadota bacterium]